MGFTLDECKALPIRDGGRLPGGVLITDCDILYWKTPTGEYWLVGRYADGEQEYYRERISEAPAIHSPGAA